MLGAEHAAPVINARSELPLSLSSDTTVPQGTADVNTQGSTEYTPLRMPTLDAEGAANEVKMPVISENAPADRKAAQFDIIRQSNPFDAELGNHTWIKFQSTPPARGATCRSGSAPGQREDFNPRPPRGGATMEKELFVQNIKISIHAPREGGRLRSRLKKPAQLRISIHAPREGGATGTRSKPMQPSAAFQSTPPARGGDHTGHTSTAQRGNFNPRPPARGGDQLEACR